MIACDYRLRSNIKWSAIKVIMISHTFWLVCVCVCVQLHVRDGTKWQC